MRQLIDVGNDLDGREWILSAHGALHYFLPVCARQHEMQALEETNEIEEANF